MCGRFVSKETKKLLAELYRAQHVTAEEFKPSHNVAPTESVPIIIEKGDNIVGVVLSRFGIPITAGGKTFPLLNIQSEKAANREDVKKRRCIIPVAGFYEWEKVGKEKQPHYFSGKQGLLSLAGVWKRDAKGLSFAIFTTTANELLAPIHGRMPVILGHNAVSQWLAPDADMETIISLFHPYSAGLMQSWKVDKVVNSPKNKDAACINSL